MKTTTDRPATKSVEAQYLRKGDVLTFTKGVVTHAPYSDLKTPAGKVNIGVNSFRKTWNKKTKITVNVSDTEKIASELKAWNDNQPSIRKNLMNDYLVG